MVSLKNKPIWLLEQFPMTLPFSLGTYMMLNHEGRTKTKDPGFVENKKQ